MNKQNEECNICNKWIGACTCATNAGHDVFIKSGTFNDNSLLSSEQAWREEAERLKSENQKQRDDNYELAKLSFNTSISLIEQRNKANTECGELQEQLNQAVEVLKDVKYQIEQSDHPAGLGVLTAINEALRGDRTG